jgi:hypothetical protein
MTGFGAKIDIFVALAIALGASHSHGEMSEIFFDHPGVGFPRQFRFFETIVRDFAFSLFRWLTVAAGGSRRVRFRLKEVEFPTASASVRKLLERTLRGSRAADRASIDALRPCNNSVNLKDNHELSFIRETLAPSARGVPTKGRSPFALSKRERESSQENILAASRRIFWKRKSDEETGDRVAQWRAAIAAFAQT